MANMEKLQEVLNLVRQTGDKIIILDSESEPYVVMDLNNYRSLLREEANVTNISEEELLDKINRLISAWKATQPDLGDYDLSQFRVDSIRAKDNQPESNSQAEATLEPINSEQEALLSKVAESEDERYYPEPDI